jgi:hypothetical protein
MNVHDYIVVGSGCSGAMAAQTLVEGKANVLMLDAGVLKTALHDLIPSDDDYLTIRKTDEAQSDYLIGPNGEGIAWGQISKGAQVTPPRQHMVALTDKYIPYTAANFSPLESLAYGGLGVGWGVQCWEYSDKDLEHTGLDIAATRKAYEIVNQRIGISATKDAAATYTIGALKDYEPSARADRNHRRIQKLYKRQADNLQSQGFHVGRTPLALLTKDREGRKAYQYRDLDFYSDQDKSAWRPWITVDELRKKTNFTYLGGMLLVSFTEKNDIVTLHCIEIESGKKQQFQCRKLILASGALGTARVALRSLGTKSDRTPLLSNPHTYIPCLQPAMLGKGSEKRKLGFGQLSYFLDAEGDDAGVSVASSYTYQSLMLFRTIGQIPFNFVDARTVSRYLLPGLVILLVQHPDKQSPEKYLKLVKDNTSPTGDKLSIHYELDDEDQATWNQREKQYVKMLRKLRLFALKRVNPGHGSGIHYAGTLPFSKKPKNLRLSPNGRLHGTQHVYAADSSGFRFLPAKGLTFTLMANAHIIAENVLHGKA